MLRRSEHVVTRPGDRGSWLPELGAALASMVLVLTVLALAASLVAPGVARAQDGLPGLPEDEGLDATIEHQLNGHPEQAERVLARLAEAGDVVAMERLALMHWYGSILYGRGPWQREVAAWWFERAAQRGSELGRHMRAVVQRTGVSAAARGSSGGRQ